ncbi:hypothetical protein HDV00_005265 [Rhizophlyctis rosea]|nr:hypothetical protein HDV00_005265 [Rhizophlyctis rosea]
METQPRDSAAYEYAEPTTLAERNMSEAQKHRFESLMKKPAHELREMLDQKGVDHRDCTEKQEYAKKVMDNVKDDEQ